MKETLAIALDLGTTTCKAIAMDATSRVVAKASCPVATHFHGDRAEQQPSEILDAAARVLRDVVSQLGGRTIAGIAISGAMHSLIPVDDEDNPLAPASLWSDRRAADQTTALRQIIDTHTLYLATGCGVRWLYHLPRIRWWLEQPDTARHIRRFVAAKDLVVHRLAGRWCTDTGLASTTGLLDIHKLTWHDAALGAAGIDASRLPTLVAPTELIGPVTDTGAAFFGLPHGTPVIGGGSDGALANLGAAGAAPGRLVVSVGTSGAVRLNVSTPTLDERERTWCYALLPGRWIAGGAIANAGLALQWVKECWFADVTYEEMTARAAAIPPAADIPLFLPYLTGERNPHWNPDARAVIEGLTLNHTRDHVARAALEGVAFCLADVLDALPPETRHATELQLTGGIVRSPAWCQIVCDVLGVPIETCEQGDASAIGAARLALAGIGAIPLASLDDPPACGSNERDTTARFTPDAGRHALYRERKERFDAMGQRLVFATPGKPGG